MEPCSFELDTLEGNTLRTAKEIYEAGKSNCCIEVCAERIGGHMRIYYKEIHPDIIYTRKGQLLLNAARESDNGDVDDTGVNYKPVMVITSEGGRAYDKPNEADSCKYYTVTRVAIAI